MGTHGIWIEDADKIDAQYGMHNYKCSNCGHYATEHVGGTENWWCISKPDYCPHCGAKMDAEQQRTVTESTILNMK